MVRKEEMDALYAVLWEGTVELKGRFVWGSNYTFLVEVAQEDQVLPAVYKPTRGERPLWDFPAASLARREAAAYLVSQALGWELVPPTVFRMEAPLGPGSLQLFIDHDPEYHYFNFNEEDRQRLRPAALFDLLINNADRKASHVLVDQDHHLWLIDHGICFHAENKLRTVIWDFVGEKFSEALAADLGVFLHRLQPPSDLVDSLADLLEGEEIDALIARATRLLARNRFPNPRPETRPYPWPPV
ncbi:MAG: SCO1664 family protein [Anaerolineales bacterium]|nr:SCO1664 family protein [Anaerolineales bacterium]